MWRKYSEQGFLASSKVANQLKAAVYLNCFAIVRNIHYGLEDILIHNEPLCRIITAGQILSNTNV